MLSKRLAIIVLTLISATACGSYSAAPSTAPSPTPTPGGASSPVAIPTGASLLTKTAYSPDDLTVAVGTTVTWMNTDSVSHTSTSDGSGWNSGTIAPGAQFSFAFQTSGTFAYHCAIHPGMVGTVIVR